ncbi:MAG TPA: response regulator [Opitutaceae bacterium]|jgi:CheY-like chemotaxis protein|nr:response regulator [Opitutaceae bacterium]
MQHPPIILIADDDEGHTILIRENLADAGLNNPMRCFRDGQALLDYLGGAAPAPAEKAPCLLLLDIRMPKVDGLTVLRRLKADPNLRRIPVVMLTTTDDPREVERCYELGCNVYIRKPVDYEKFAEAIRRLGLFVTLVLEPLAGGD